MIKDINNNDILNNSILNNSFLSASLREIKQNCKILKTDFYLDSFNYFPITLDYSTFDHLFKREDDNSIEHFFSEKFFENLKNNEKSFKNINNCYVLGSSPADNYFSNLIHFLPRIFFDNNKKLNLVIHRNLSNKFRNLLKSICEMRNIEVQFYFIDDEFYRFSNSSMPQFFSIKNSIGILKFFFSKILSNVKDQGFGKKIYIRREGANYRKILNEADLINLLRKNGFEIINPNHFEILQQMKIFSNAELIISPHGSNLSNIIFCNTNAKIYEIGPNFNKPYEVNISNRYNILSNVSRLKYFKINSDSVDVDSHSDIAKKYISKKVLDESNYYKNIILKINEISELVNSL